MQFFLKFSIKLKLANRGTLAECEAFFSYAERFKTNNWKGQQIYYKKKIQHVGKDIPQWNKKT